MRRLGFLPVVACFIAGVASAETGGAEQSEVAGDSQIPLIGQAESGVDDSSDELYQDEYLLEDDASIYDIYIDDYEALLGRRFFATEVVYYKNDASVFGHQLEQGVRMRWRRETLNFGELEADIVFSDIDREFFASQHSNTEAMITLRQRGAPISDTWLMNNTIGYQRSLTGDHVGGGYRVRLPSSPLLGVSGEFMDSTRSAQWFTGRTGHVEGVALNQFKKDGGTLNGAAFQQQVSPSWSLFGELVSFSGNELVSGHTSMLSAARYISEDQTRTYDVSLLVDDDSNAGLWADAEHVLDHDILMRYGAYVLGSDLAWMDKPIINDEVGVYFRTDKQSYSYSMSAGYDYARTGLSSSNPATTEFHNVYFNGNFRVTRNLNLGTAGTLAMRRLSSLQNDEQLSWRLNNFAFYRSWFGTSRFEVYFSRIDSGAAASLRETRGVLASQQWRMPQSLRLTTEIRLEDGKTGQFDTREFEANVTFRQDMGEQFSWGINASLFRGTGDQTSSQDGLGINADLRWGFLPNWYASVILSRSAARFESDTIFPGNTVENETTGNTFWLTVGYGKASGQPIHVLGEGSSSGSGRIQGEVFLDENGDFIRQPSERPVIGAVVLLDGRYEARTDGMGRYSFEPVYTGTHRVSLEVSDLPLPWGLHDETPRIVNVSFRHSGEANFALTRLN